MQWVASGCSSCAKQWAALDPPQWRGLPCTAPSPAKCATPTPHHCTPRHATMQSTTPVSDGLIVFSKHTLPWFPFGEAPPPYLGLRVAAAGENEGFLEAARDGVPGVFGVVALPPTRFFVAAVTVPFLPFSPLAGTASFDSSSAGGSGPTAAASSSFFAAIYLRARCPRETA